MLFRDREYTCAHCGEVLDLPALADPQVVIRAATGGATSEFSPSKVSRYTAAMLLD
jgi:hypothetical protein